MVHAQVNDCDDWDDDGGDGGGGDYFQHNGLKRAQNEICLVLQSFDTLILYGFQDLENLFNFSKLECFHLYNEDDNSSSWCEDERGTAQKSAWC